MLRSTELRFCCFLWSSECVANHGSRGIWDGGFKCGFVDFDIPGTLVQPVGNKKLPYILPKGTGKLGSSRL